MKKKKSSAPKRGMPSSRQTYLAAIILVAGCVIGAQLDSIPIVAATAAIFVLILIPRKK